MAKRLSICVVTQQLGKIVSGPGLHAINLIRFLIQDGHIVTVIAPKSQIAEKPVGFSLITVPDPPLFKNQFRWFPLSLSFAKKIQELEKNQKFDVIHFIDAREAFFTHSSAPMVGNVNDTYAAELKSFKYYRKYFGDWAIRKIYYHFVHVCENLVFGRFDALIANSTYTAKTVLSSYQLDGKKVWTCYKSIHADKYLTARKGRTSGKSHGVRVLFVGGNMQRKGLPAIIHAAPKVIVKIPEIEFWIVGSDPAEVKMKQLCDEIGVSDHFKFWGWKSQSELLTFYRDADIFVLPSITEAFGVVFLEAMAAGLPVIGTNVGGIPEIIRNGQNGMLVPPDRPDLLGKAIIELLSNRDLYTRMQKQGADTVSLFSVENMMRCTYRIYDAVLL
jgi:glycosyltransferase involved in cell wall biosynthesis